MGTTAIFNRTMLRIVNAKDAGLGSDIVPEELKFDDSKNKDTEDSDDFENDLDSPCEEK